MARALWSGSLAFGLVNVPVGMYSATEDKTIHFRQFQRGTSSRIRYRRVNEDTGEEVDYSDIVKGYDLGGGQYVILDPEELEEIAPGRSRSIDITDFVEAAEIDPIFYQKTYYLAPQDPAAERAYTLLARAMDAAGRIGVATFVMRSKQYLAAIRSKDDLLTLETMFFADEVRDPAEEIDKLPTDVSISRKDLDMGVSLIETMTTPWDPENYRDTYRDRVLDLVEAKRRGEEVVSTEEAPAETNVVDLMEALQRSVDAARGRHTPGNRHQVTRLDTRPRETSGSGASGSGRSASGGSASDRSASGRSASGGEHLDTMAKKELYDLAKQLDVAGRSSMSKEELVDAVAQARQQRQAS